MDEIEPHNLGEGADSDSGSGSGEGADSGSGSGGDASTSRQPSEGHTLITCVEISSHKDLFTVSVDDTTSRKPLFVMVGGVFNFGKKISEDYFRENFPELGILDKSNAINANSVRSETCVKVSSISSIFRLNVKGEKNFSVCLVILFGLSAREKEKIRAKAVSQFPNMKVFEYQGRKGKSTEWVMALVGGVVASVVLYYGIREAKKETGKHLGAITLSVASIGTSMRSLATSVSTYVGSWCDKG